MKNDEETNYFSKIGKKLNIKYGNVYIEYKDKKKLLHNYYRQQLDNFLLDEEERSKNRNIFDNLLLKKRNKLMLEDEDSSSDSYNPDKKKKPINIYKYHQLHLEKIERLKTSHFPKEKPICLSYNPNYKLVKKSIITGPKWDSLTGRKPYKKLILDNSFSSSKNLKIPKLRKKGKIKKPNFKTMTKNFSFNNMTQNIQKLAKNLIIKKSPIKELNKPLKKIITHSKSKIKKVTPLKKVQVMSVFPKLYTPKTYYLKETDIKDKNLKNIFFIKTSPKNSIGQKKLVKSNTKIFRNHVIGLSNEQIKAINEFRKNNKNLKTKIKKLNPKKILYKKNNLSLNDIKNDFNSKMLSCKENITGISTSEKSFNYLINKSLLEKSNKEIIRNNYRSLFLDFYKFKKNREFYKYDADKIYDYSFSKFDNRIFRDIK